MASVDADIGDVPQGVRRGDHYKAHCSLLKNGEFRQKNYSKQQERNVAIRRANDPNLVKIK